MLNLANARFLRGFTFIFANFLWMYLLNVYLVYWLDYPPLRNLSSVSSEPIATSIYFRLAAVLLLLVAGILWARNNRTLELDANLLSRISAFIIRATFWSVFLVGIVDATISLLRVEEMLDGLVGEALATQLGRPSYRGIHVHFPLIGAGIVLAFLTRGFVAAWLAVLVVLAEFLIVITRFIFSYEQAYMGDLVRFWYAGLFLFTSAYTLVNEGHVRVDVLYAQFGERKKAWANLFGSLLLGLPLCWIILTQGMSGKGASLLSPLLNFEISQSGFGMYVKYLMSAYLVIFAASMTLQFCCVALRCSAVINDEVLNDDPQYDPEQSQSTEFHSEPVAEV